MPKSSNQKLKLLYLRRILLEETDDNHHLNAEQLVSKLEQLGINADRKTIYADVAALQDYGMDIFLQRGPGGGYSVSSREFELPELKLLVDAVQPGHLQIHQRQAHQKAGGPHLPLRGQPAPAPGLCQRPPEKH